jgi:S-layer homology domain
MDAAHTAVANFARRRHSTDLPPGPPPYEAISQLAARLIILGYSNGNFGPDDTTQRAQMAALGRGDHRRPDPLPECARVNGATARPGGVLPECRCDTGYGRHRRLAGLGYPIDARLVRRGAVAGERQLLQRGSGAMRKFEVGSAKCELSRSGSGAYRDRLVLRVGGFVLRTSNFQLAYGLTAVTDSEMSTIVS